MRIKLISVRIEFENSVDPRERKGEGGRGRPVNEVHQFMPGCLSELGLSLKINFWDSSTVKGILVRDNRIQLQGMDQVCYVST
ncbi:hypothetical protein VNO77_17627 [Canavalia gladiata]|uniref:Uncharacterized protein n=1 Tax=Canavalia gladiata TaxID=3824 RepID=A0AAN9QMW0_CANGL